MIVPLEDRWGLLAFLEQEHGAREALRRLQVLKELKFLSLPEKNQSDFLRDTACLYIAQSLKQSKELFRQAETSSWLVKPLLLYYAMLACAKGCLVFATPDFMKSKSSRVHGIHTNNEFRTDIDLTTDIIKSGSQGIYPLLRAALELPPLPHKLKIPIHQILTRLPEVDINYRLMFKEVQQPLDWFKIFGDILVQTEKGFHTEFSLSEALYKEVGDRLPSSLIEKYNAKHDLDKDGQPREFFSSKDVWPNQPAAVSWGMPTTVAKMLDNNFAVILPLEIEGVKYDIGEIELMFLLMFYFSSIARYQPHLWLQLHAGTRDFSPILCRDLLNCCENKFLYLLNAKLNYTVSLPLTEPPATAS